MLMATTAAKKVMPNAVKESMVAEIWLYATRSNRFLMLDRINVSEQGRWKARRRYDLVADAHANAIADAEVTTGEA